VKQMPFFVLLCFVVVPCGRLLSQSNLTTSDMVREASRILPVEERYDYHKTFLTGSIHSLKRSSHAVLQPNEFAIESGKWQIVYPRQAGPLTIYAVEDSREFFQRAMNVAVTTQEVAQFEQPLILDRSIIVGTKAQFQQLGSTVQPIGGKLVRSKDYEIRTAGRQIQICGCDDAGVMHGLFHLQSRLKLREAPFLVKDWETVRNSRYQTRMILSWLGWMEWPDNYLAHLAHDGYDAIYASGYANPNGVEGPPHYDLIRKQNPKELKELIRRAAKFGIRVYTPILFNNTGEADNEQQLRELVRDIVTQFPEIRGYVLLTEGFFYKQFVAGNRSNENIEEWTRIWTRAVGIVAEECHRLDPTIEVLPWEYNIDFRPEKAELKRRIVQKLPLETIPLLTWENGKQFEIDGLKGYLRDYSISQVGPSEVAAAQIAEAKQRGMKTYCKVDCFATWQFGTLPYIPCPQQWQKRYDALAEHAIDGTMESWSNGYKPNIFSELRCWSCWTDSLPANELWHAYAQREFGSQVKQKVVKAWEQFSEAIRLLPDTGPSMGTNNAVANPLFFKEPPPRIMTLHHSWWDEEKKTPWRHKMIDAWPFCHKMMVFMPDFTNRTNAAEKYAQARSGIGTLSTEKLRAGQKVLPVFDKYLVKSADELEKGLRLYREAALSAPPEKKPAAIKEVLVAEQMQNSLRSLHALLQFEDQRLSLHASLQDKAAAESLLNSMVGLLSEEIERTNNALQIARLDSRFGYECEMDYVYTPMVIEEKLQALQKTLDEEIPSFRKTLK
jgi:hypothetical protein